MHHLKSGILLITCLLPAVVIDGIEKEAETQELEFVFHYEETAPTDEPTPDVDSCYQIRVNDKISSRSICVTATEEEFRALLALAGGTDQFAEFSAEFITLADKLYAEGGDHTFVPVFVDQF